VPQRYIVNCPLFELPSPECLSRRTCSSTSFFQGFESAAINIETQATRYLEGQGYSSHYDLGGPNLRHTTIIAFLEANCTNCGTKFPLLSSHWDETMFPFFKHDWDTKPERLCRYIECKSEALVVNPVARNAIFCRNLHQNGTGDLRTLHAGLPVTEGTKVGLNIWTRANGSYNGN
jgi:prolyl 4-hydroxylase